MSKKYEKLSVEQWREIAKKILRAEEAVHELVDELGGKFPVGTALDKSVQILNRVKVLKSDLDDVLVSQSREMKIPVKDVRTIFYPYIFYP